MIRYDILPSRCGDLLVAIDERGLLHVDFVAGLRALPDMSGWRQDKVALAPF
ncbi:TPA: cysteine methyltransferase, partial [Aeromonas hydrophila]|nr:cysteine methyltransferase [Aeromonas hydrophila]